MAMKIFALVTDAFGGWGGIARYNRDFLSATCRSDGVARVVCLPRLVSRPLEALPDKLSFDACAAHGLGSYLRAVLRHARSLGAAELIYCGHINLVPLAVLLGAAARKPVVLQVHGIDAWTPPRRRQAALLAGRADAVVSTSRLTLDRFRSWSGIPESRCSVIPCMYEAAAFRSGAKSDDLAARYGLAGRTVILTLGRLVSEARAKGFDEVLEVLPGLVRTVPTLAYVIAGTGPDRSRLEDKVSRLGLDERVIFTGEVPETEKADLYRLADAYVMPSRGEGFGITLLEAMACGTPVVGSTRDGTGEALRGGRLGVLVDPLDSADVERGILLALESARGVPPGLEYFSQEKFGERVQALLDRVARL
jgi:phosphatidyl-myo-inositol dimannoside synthase